MLRMTDVARPYLAPLVPKAAHTCAPPARASLEATSIATLAAGVCDLRRRERHGRCCPHHSLDYGCRHTRTLAPRAGLKMGAEQ